MVLSGYRLQLASLHFLFSSFRGTKFAASQLRCVVFKFIEKWQILAIRPKFTCWFLQWFSNRDYLLLLNVLNSWSFLSTQLLLQYQCDMDNSYYLPFLLFQCCLTCGKLIIFSLISKIYLITNHFIRNPTFISFLLLLIIFPESTLPWFLLILDVYFHFLAFKTSFSFFDMYFFLYFISSLSICKNLLCIVCSS